MVQKNDQQQAKLAKIIKARQVAGTLVDALVPCEPHSQEAAKIEAFKQCVMEALADEDPDLEALTMRLSETDFGGRECRVCGCTEVAACFHDDGTPCAWMTEDLCTVCADKLATLPARMAAILAEIVDENLFVSPGAPLGYPATLRLAHFNEALAERVAGLLEEAEAL